MSSKIVFLFETSWDSPQLEACRASWADRFEIEFAEPSDADAAWDLDIVGLIEQQCQELSGRAAGVLSTSDYPGATVAAAVATRLGLPGSTPRAVLGASHKFESRIAQRRAAPQAVPGFALVDPDDPATLNLPFDYPCFVKPVKGAFSVMSRKVTSHDDLVSFVTSDKAKHFRASFLGIFAQLAEHYELAGGRSFLAEQLVRGRQVTVEGWRAENGGGIIGIVDSVMRPDTGSFVRFDYPSTLPSAVQQRMKSIADAIAAEVGLQSTLYNIEMTWDESNDDVMVIEVNPRACGQFGDLYQKVDGVHGYEVALALAAGQEIPRGLQSGAGSFGAALSVPLRVFEPVRVAAVPDAEVIRQVQASFPGTLVWVECQPGEILDPTSELEDGQSFRYAVVNVGGRDHEDAERVAREVEAALRFQFEPLPKS